MPEDPWRVYAGVVVAFLGFLAPCVQAQSAADLTPRLHIDGRTHDYRTVEACFRNAAVCAQLVPRPVCGPDEERDDDSRSNRFQDVRQIYVTWDAHALYVAVDATIENAALIVLLDVRPGGLTGLGNLPAWRHAVRCTEVLRPDLFLAVGDRGREVEAWRARGDAAIERIASADFTARATFDGDAADRSLEAALPWTLLFPETATAVDTEPGAPAEPIFVLPPESSRAGLRIAALVVGTSDGFGARDVAPDPLGGVPLDARDVSDIDRAVQVAWDEHTLGAPPQFVDFGAAVQTQSAPRLLPSGPTVVPAALGVQGLRTYAGSRVSRLLLADAGLDLAFAFDVALPYPEVLFLSAAIFSARGERVIDLARDVRRTRGTPVAPFGAFSDPLADRWDGRDRLGRPVPAGTYVLQVRTTLAPGGTTTESAHSITVVR